MENTYKTLKDKHSKEFNEFPMQFAFSDEQFKEGMKKLGLKETETHKVYSFGGGGFYRRTDSPALGEMIERHNREMKEAIENDRTGEGYIFDMFDYELANHEYSYTWDLEPTLDALGLTLEEVKANERLLHGLNLAKKNQQ
jgi:hypothetical protein